MQKPKPVNKETAERKQFIRNSGGWIIYEDYTFVSYSEVPEFKITDVKARNKWIKNKVMKCKSVVELTQLKLGEKP